MSHFHAAFQMGFVCFIWLDAGKPPLQAEWLYRLTRLKVFAQLHGISEIKADKYALKIERQRGGRKEEKSFLLPLIKQPIEVDEKWMPLIKKWITRYEKADHSTMGL